MTGAPPSRPCSSCRPSRKKPASRPCSCHPSGKKPASRPRFSGCHPPNGEPAVYGTSPKRKLASAFRIAPLLLCLAGCRSTPPPTPLDQLTAQQSAGYNVFQTRCAVCHYERTGQAKQGPPLISLYKKPYLPSGAPANDDRITNTVLHGHGLMPAQPSLDPDDLSALLAYLHTV